MLGYVFNEKKRINMAIFMGGRRASAPSEARVKLFFDVIALYYKSLHAGDNNIIGVERKFWRGGGQHTPPQ